MAVTPIAGIGTVFNRKDPTTQEFVAIASINSIEGPTMSRDTIDTTALDTEGGYRTFIAGFRNAGTITLAMNFTAQGFILMKSDFESNDLVDYQIVLPDTDETTLTFSGIVTEMPLSIPTDDKVTVNVTIQISGPVTLS